MFCGAAEMVHDTRDVPYTYKGQETTIHNVTGEFCPACNESIHNAQESEQLNAAMLAFTKEVNSATVSPAFIAETRKKLNLDQREAAVIFGGGPNGFSRYENGKTRPPLSLVQLFKLLNKHPELLDELRQKKQDTAVTERRIARRKRMYA
jgi:HTH-type transcriptional regulator/antitoxin MqsA